ncbi:unnamed protein product, partial [Rotaria sp. Silwood1]
MINNFNPIPLTTKRLEQYNGSKSAMVASMTTTEDNENEETNPMIDLPITENGVDDDDDDHDNDNSAYSSSSITNLGTWSVTDLLSTDFQSSTEHHDLALGTDVDPVPDVPIPSLSTFIDEKIGQPKDTTEKVTIDQVSEANIHARQDDAAKKAQATMELENEQLKAKIVILEREVEEKTKNLNENDAASAARLSTTIDRLEDLQKELNAKTEKENLMTKTAEQISTAHYTVPKSNQSILSKFNLIVNTLRKLSYPLKEYFKDNIPLIDLEDDNDGKITLKGFPIHHQELKKILERWQKLVQQIQSAEEYYSQKTNKNIQSLLRIIHRVHPKNPTYWKPYCNSLVKLINQKYDSYVQKFKNRMKDELKKLLDTCIQHPMEDFRKVIIDSTNDYMKEETFSDDVESLKMTALNEFIHEYIFLQQKSTKTIPTKESASALNKHIETVKNTLTKNADYKGCELKHFQLIVSLLQRLMILYHCFLVQLPLFNASLDLLNKIANNTVITIETATGS